jgi:hypothetical protein
MIRGPLRTAVEWLVVVVMAVVIEMGGGAVVAPCVVGCSVVGRWVRIIDLSSSSSLTLGTS